VGGGNKKKKKKKKKTPKHRPKKKEKPLAGVLSAEMHGDVGTFPGLGRKKMVGQVMNSTSRESWADVKAARGGGG